MQLNRQTWGLVLLLVAGGLLVIQPSQAEDEESDLARLPIQHSADDGARLWYQPLGLKNATLRFHETPGTLSETGQLIDYTLWRDDARNLERIHLVLRAEPDRRRAAPPNSQADSLPDSRYTVYEDLDGDSVFDTMVQVARDSIKSFILFENRWIEVRTFMQKRDIRRTARTVEGDQQYSFEKGGWKR